MPSVSVLLPCYNACRTLDEALESLVNQSFTDFEVVAVDDGSSDETLQILQSWAAQDVRLRILHHQHRGIIETLNAGLEACCTPLVARMDADDRSHPLRLERQVRFMGEHPEIDVVICLVEGFPGEQVREGYQIYIEWMNSLTTDAAMRREMFVESPLVHPSVMVRRELLEQVHGYEEHGWAEDYDLWLRLYLAGARFSKVEEVLLAWREDPQRLTRVDSRYTLEHFLRAKAHYLMLGPLRERDGVIIWGAGMIGRRLGRLLAKLGCPLAAFIDIDPRKIGRTRGGRPILQPEALPEWLGRFEHPAVLAAVGLRGAREEIRQRIAGFELEEGKDWWAVA
ncbi:MAG: glycosyltransferase [Anaerolineales bacterium]|nr:glycosyltransferase [Anaerolineales bacterium]